MPPRGGDGISGIDELQNITGLIFNIQYFCVHDGPGIRATVFFKGCPLSCAWCHNPEGIPRERLLSFAEGKCVSCGECVKICPEAHGFEGGKHVLHRERCPDALLGASAASCAVKALTVVGESVTAGELLERLSRDRRYYEASGGGITFSGGEPTVQQAFLTAMLKLCAREGLSAMLETCGFCDYAYLESILPYVGLFLYDYKESDAKKHKAFTGADNMLIIKNLERLHGAGARIILRCPIIPGLNDREDHFKAIAQVTTKYRNIMGADLLPYHRLASSKAGRMGLEAQGDYEQPSSEVVESWKVRVRAYGGRVVQT